MNNVHFSHSIVLLFPIPSLSLSVKQKHTHHHCSFVASYDSLLVSLTVSYVNNRALSLCAGQGLWLCHHTEPPVDDNND